ncbi:MAG: reverse transcriptase family protein [Sedimenticola sp.]
MGDDTPIEIAVLNVEGVKGNASFLINLARQHKIICIQETWIWSYEDNVIKNLVPNYEAFVRCDDMNETISNFQAPRGKAGIAIMWPKNWSGSIKSLECGNERIQAIELHLKQAKICIINAYLPTLNLPTSKDLYAEHLDILHNIIMRYADTHEIVICGDMNGSLLNTRSNTHDVLLKEFTLEHELENTHDVNTKPTFYSHTGSTSQIDYILTKTSGLVHDTVIADPHPTNLSTHVTVSTKLNFSLTDLKVYIRKSSQPLSIQKYQWEKADIELYQDKLEKSLDKCTPSLDVDNTIVLLTSSLNKAAGAAIPRKQVKLRGPNFKLSPTVKMYEDQSKKAHFEWKQAGCPSIDHHLSVQRKLAKYALRKQTRREFASNRDSLFNEIMENPSDRLFYKLIRRSQSSKHTTSCIIIDDEESTCPQRQSSAFAAYFEDLAVPKKHSNFSEDYLDLAEVQVDLIKQIFELQNDLHSPVTEDEVEKAISSLNSGKSPDESQLAAEHLKLAGSTITPLVITLFNQILESKTVPNSFKSGILTPIHKKGKDPTKVESYRGITITSVLGKAFEIVLLNRMKELDNDQSELQFGFSKGLSPAMASLMVSEAVIDAKNSKESLYMATLDSQKAFDVVHHQILLAKLYHQGIDSSMWPVIQSMYSDLSGKVKWSSEVSDSFKIHQGVRQGGILSTLFYKIYINQLLLDLESQHMGKHIGTVYVGCPTCADDVLLMATDSIQLQAMLDVVNAYSRDHRYLIHPQKSAVVRRVINKNGHQREISSTWRMGPTDMAVEKQTKHLGLIRTADNETSVNIEDRIKLARRTLYALMRTGVHGTNGIDPKTAYKIYQMYVIPRLLYSLETLILTATQVNQLERFHTKTLKNFQSLPLRTATSAVLLLLGALPVEAEIHRRQLSLMYAIAHTRNSKLRLLMERQIVMGYKTSFFSTASTLLQQYNLPPITDLPKYPKLRWKYMTKTAIGTYWTEKLTEDAKSRSTLNYCNIPSLRIGLTHPVWETLNSNTNDVKMGITKARILTGTYLLQSNKAKFNKYEVNETCPLCRLGPEDREHMLTRCPALLQSRQRVLHEIRTIITTKCGPHFWNQISTRQLLTSLIIDCRTLVRSDILPNDDQVLREIEVLSRKLCHKLHVRRLQEMRKLN